MTGKELTEAFIGARSALGGGLCISLLDPKKGRHCHLDWRSGFAGPQWRDLVESSVDCYVTGDILCVHYVDRKPAKHEDRARPKGDLSAPLRCGRDDTTTDCHLIPPARVYRRSVLRRSTGAAGTPI